MCTYYLVYVYFLLSICVLTIYYMYIYYLLYVYLRRLPCILGLCVLPCGLVY